MSIYNIYRSVFSDDDDTCITILKEYVEYEDDINDYIHYLLIEMEWELGGGHDIGNIIDFPKNPLHQAIRARNARVVEYLLKEKNFNANIKDPYTNHCPLYTLSSIPNMINTYAFLEISDENVDIISDYVNKAKKLKLSKSVCIAILKEIIKGNTNLTNEDLKRLDDSIIKKELLIAKILLDNGADLSFVDEDGRIPLCNSVINGNLELTKMFIDNTPDRENICSDYEIFDLAVISGNINLVKEIVSRNFKRRSYILCKASGSRNIEMVKYLLYIGLDVNIKDLYNETPLHEAVKSGSMEMVQLLLHHGAIVNVKDVISLTPLDHASSYPEIVKLLLENGADPNITDDEHIFTSLRYSQPNIVSCRYIISYILLNEYRFPNNNKNREGYKVNCEIIQNIQEFKKIKESCEKELEMLDSIKISKSHSLKTFVLYKDIKFLSELARCSKVKNINIDSFLNYGSILKKSIHDSLERLKELKDVLDIIDNLLEYTYWNVLPVEIRSKIVSFLNYSDISLLKNNCKNDI